MSAGKMYIRHVDRVAPPNARTKVNSGMIIESPVITTKRPKDNVRVKTTDLSSSGTLQRSSKPSLPPINRRGYENDRDKMIPNLATKAKGSSVE